MGALKRQKTRYPGVTFRIQPDLENKTSQKVFYIRYRKGGRGSKEIEETVGSDLDGMTASKANIIRSKRIAGEDSSNQEKRREAFIAESEKSWLLKDIWEDYKLNHPEHKGRSNDENRYKNHISKRFGNKAPEEIYTSDINKMKSELLKKGRKPSTIQRIIVQLRAIINYGVESGYCGLINPQKLVFKSMKVDNEKTEVMTDSQLKAYLRALDEEKDQDAVALIRLALVTGMRKGSLLALRWDDCDFERGTIRLRGECSKKGKTSFIPMNNSARHSLEGISSRESEFVWPGRHGNKRVDYRRLSRRVKAKAGLPADFRPLHGLRHNFASRLASSGKVDLYTLQKLMTHESFAMTQRYAHLQDQTLRQASALADEMLRFDIDS